MRELRKGPKLRLELVKSVVDAHLMSVKKLEKTLAELENDGLITRKAAEVPGTRKYTSLYALKEDRDLLDKYVPRRIGEIPGRKPSTLEGLLKRAIPELRSRLKRNPTKEEIALEIGKTPKVIEKSLFRVAKSLRWIPPQKVLKVKVDEYEPFSDKSKHMRKDSIKILREQGLSDFNTLTIKGSSFKFFSALVLSGIKEISLAKLGFPRTFRFLMDVQSENWNKRRFFLLRDKHRSEHYHDPKYNNIWLEISYKRIRKSSLENLPLGLPHGHTLTSITPSLMYFGPDKATYIFRDLDQEALSRLNYVPRWVNDKRLSNEAIRNLVRNLKYAKREKKLVEKELSILETYHETKQFFSDIGWLWMGPGFFIHNVRSKDDIRDSIAKMLGWIEDNGDWL